MSATCGSCDAPIVWAKTSKGALMPIDAQPADDGNLAVHRDDQGELHARVLKAGDSTAEWEKRGTSHWATCPNAEQHRRKR